MPRRRGGPGIGLFLLAAQVLQVGYNHIPPTTLATIGLNVAIYLKLLHPFFKGTLSITPSIGNICVSTYHVWYKSDWTRLLLAGWFHLDDWHLYYNMSSLLWKGRGLEPMFGTVYFAYVLLIFSVLTNVVMVGVNIVAAELLQDQSYVISCAAGFSGVLFALKVLSSSYTPAHMQHIFGIPVPSKWACWIELVVIQLLVPNASFTGHLAGILVGLAYVNGPLKTLMDIVFSRDLYVSSGFATPSYTYSSGTASSRTRRTQSRPARERSNDERSSGGRTSYTYTARATGNTGGRTTGTAARPTQNAAFRANDYTADTAARRTGNAAFRANDYTAGMSEDEQMDTAVNASYQANNYTAGMTEEEQIEAAMRESLRIGESSSASSVPRTQSSSRTPNISSPTLPSYSHHGPSTSNTTHSQGITRPSTSSTPHSQGITRPFTSNPTDSLYKTRPSTSSTTHSSGITRPSTSTTHSSGIIRPSSSTTHSQHATRPSTNISSTTHSQVRPPSQYPNPYLRQRSAGTDPDFVRRMRLNRFDQSGT